MSKKAKKSAAPFELIAPKRAKKRPAKKSKAKSKAKRMRGHGFGPKAKKASQRVVKGLGTVLADYRAAKKQYHTLGERLKALRAA